MYYQKLTIENSLFNLLPFKTRLYKILYDKQTTTIGRISKNKPINSCRRVVNLFNLTFINFHIFFVAAPLLGNVANIAYPLLV